MKYLDIICPRCNAQVDVSCNRPGGRSCDTHCERVTASLVKLNAVIPVISQPVMALKEKFTLKGELLSISTCMKALGLELDKQDGHHFCFWPVQQDTQFTLIYSGDRWEEATYAVDAENYETTHVSEAEVIMKLIRRYYMLKVANQLKADMSVLSSLSTRLLPLAGHGQLDMLRADIKRMACPVK